MENQIVDTVTLGGSVADLDFSLIALFMRADLIVKSVILILIVASVWCWAIILQKWSTVRRLNKSSNDFEQGFWSGTVSYTHLRVHET